MPRTPVLGLPSPGPVEPSLLCFPVVCCYLSPHTEEYPHSSGLFPLPHTVFISFIKKKKNYSHLNVRPLAKTISAFPSLFPFFLNLTQV